MFTAFGVVSYCDILFTVLQSYISDISSQLHGPHVSNNSVQNDTQNNNNTRCSTD